MSFSDPIKISNLPNKDTLSEGSVFPTVDSAGNETGKVSIGTLREVLDLSNAFSTIEEGMSKTIVNEDFFVYTDENRKELALRYRKVGSGSVVYVDENNAPILYTTNRFQISQPIQVSSFSDIKGLKNLRDKQKVELTIELNARVYNRGTFIVDLTDKTTEDDGGVNLVTNSGVRLSRVIEDGNMELVWFKSESNSWDDAFDGLIKYRTKFTSNAGKVFLPAMKIVLTKPVILPYFNKGAKCSWFLEGAGSAPDNGTVLSFNIPRSTALANGWDNVGAIDNWGSEFKFNSLTLCRLCVEGISTKIANPGDEVGFAFCHGVKCRTTGSLWEDVVIQNFRGSGLYLDNAFDNTFNRVGVFASGRLNDGKDYMSYVDIGDPANQAFPPVWVTSSRQGDASNFLSWYGGSFELNNCTPFLKVDGGIQIHFTNLHSERPGRGSGMTGSLPTGTFAQVQGEVWFTQCGISNFSQSVALGPYANVQINDCPRFSGGISLINPSAKGKVRLNITNSFIGDAYFTGSIETDFRFVNTQFASLRLPVVSGQVAITNCLVLGNVDIVAGSGSILQSASGIRMVNTVIQGSVTGDANSQRITLLGCHVLGDVTLGNGNCTVLGNTILGTVSVPSQPSNFVMGIHVQSPNVISVKTSPSEISGTVRKGQVAIAYDGTATDSMWICNTAGVGAAAKWSKLVMA